MFSVRGGKFKARLQLRFAIFSHFVFVTFRTINVRQTNIPKT